LAAPTPQKYERQSGRYGFTIWTALWTDTNNLTDSSIVDISALSSGHTSFLRVNHIRYVCTTGIDFTLEFDATSDEFIYRSCLGERAEWKDFDFSLVNNEGGLVKTASGGTGDLVLTTTSAASADCISLIVHWSAN